MSKVLLGIDQSTSGTKVVVMDSLGHLIHKVAKPHKQYYPQPGWVEHDMEEVYENVVALLKEVIDLFKGEDILGLSITNQRETVVFWDKETGKPIGHALVWQCRRGAGICDQLTEKGYAQTIYSKTGLQLDTYFSASKMTWALGENKNIQEAADENRLCIGTVDAYLLYRLTEEKRFATDVTNASRTLLYNIRTNQWDDELLEIFGVKKEWLPEICDSNSHFGTLDKAISDLKLPIAGVIGDSQGALFGQSCYSRGKAKVTYGTGSSILIYAGTDIETSNDLLTSIAWSIDGQVHYALEGIINSSGDTLKWVKENLGMFSDDSEINDLVKSVDSCEGVYVIPAFSGLGAPYWEQEARAAIVGMTRRSDKRHIVRAALESIAYQVADILDKVAGEGLIEVKTCYVDGGPSKNEFLMDFQADLLQSTLVKRSQEELSVIGALYLGGLALGLWKDLETLEGLGDITRTYQPMMEKDQAHQLIENWREAVKRVL